MKNKKKKSSKKNINRFNYLKICIITVLVIVIGVGLYFFLTAEDDETSLTILEKQWIMRNKKTLVDINVPNNLSVLSDNGKGVVFDYLSKVEKDTGLKFNKKSYNYRINSDELKGLSIAVLSNEDRIKDTDVLLTEDNYVLIGLNEGYLSNLNDLYNRKVGILKTDKSIVSNYVNTNYNYIEYDDIESLISALKSSKVNYAIAPRYYALNEVVSNNAYIKYSFNDLSNKIVLRVEDNNRLSDIMVKYLNSFKTNNYMSRYEKEFMNFYLNNTSATELDILTFRPVMVFIPQVHIDSLEITPYVGHEAHDKQKLYNFHVIILDDNNNVMKYKLAIGNNIIKDYSDDEDLYTVSSFSPQMVAISKTDYRISNKEGLENRKLYTTENSYLEKYLKDNYNSVVNTIKNVDSAIPDDGILVLDEIDYHYYSKKNKLDDYYLLLKDNYSADYKFYIKTDEQSMYNFINFMLMYTDGSDIKVEALNKLVSSSESKGGFVNMYLMVVLIIVIPVIVLFAILALTRTRKNIKILRKEDILKYNDMLTSLKNRNYLNAHIDEWDEQKIIPRTIIIADLNNLKYINDNYGGDEGDLLIKKAAAILINTQLEKSEIIRTDGNEFLIYLIGYNKTQVSTYINKLSREFEKLPHGFGAAIGYSMIEDEIKTIDDAINEASIEMRADKEQNYK